MTLVPMILVFPILDANTALFNVMITPSAQRIHVLMAFVITKKSPVMTKTLVLLILVAKLPENVSMFQCIVMIPIFVLLILAMEVFVKTNK